MIKQTKEFKELTRNIAEHLKVNLRFSPNAVDEYHKIWRRVSFFMESKGYLQYNPDVEKQLLTLHFGSRTKADLTNRTERRIYNGIKMLSEFMMTKTVSLIAIQAKEPIAFKGPIGDILTGFMDYNRTVKRLSNIRLRCHARNLLKLYDWCKKAGANSINDIDLPFLLHFINGLDATHKTTVENTISSLRGFMKYVFDQKLTAKDYSLSIPRYRSVNQPKLPSVYAKEDIEKLIGSVERFSVTGKRNYAILLLAARLGLRASDICRLKFENIHWQTSAIKLEQYKTGKELVLPLLPDIGNAIIDYLKYSRPESEESYIFLTARPPYIPFSTSNVVTHVVQRAFIKAGINISGKRFGPHSLRHSLGFRMLEESTVLPVISEVLGHASTESTRYYLRIDLKSMQQCMLDVPAVSIDFYEQKGGVFYG